MENLNEEELLHKIRCYVLEQSIERDNITVQEISEELEISIKLVKEYLDKISFF